MLMTNLRVEVYASQREAHKNNDLGLVRLSATSQFGTRILPNGTALGFCYSANGARRKKAGGTPQKRVTTCRERIRPPG